MWNRYDKAPLRRIGARVASVLTMLSAVVWALWPADWNVVDGGALAAFVPAVLCWLGLEISQYFIDSEPIQHPSDLDLASEIEEKFPLQHEYFFRNHDFGNSFEQKYADVAVFMAHFGREDRRAFQNDHLQKQLRALSNLCKEWCRSAFQRGGPYQHSYYIVMSEREYVDEASSWTDETAERIRRLNDIGDEIAEARVKLSRAFGEFLPSLCTQQPKAGFL